MKYKIIFLYYLENIKNIKKMHKNIIFCAFFVKYSGFFNYFLVFLHFYQKWIIQSQLPLLPFSDNLLQSLWPFLHHFLKVHQPLVYDFDNK